MTIVSEKWTQCPYKTWLGMNKSSMFQPPPYTHISVMNGNWICDDVYKNINKINYKNVNLACRADQQIKIT